MTTTGTITDLSIDFNTKKAKITLLLDGDIIEAVEKLKSEQKLNISLKKYSKKRSLTANGYCWELCDKIAKELCKDGAILTKEDIYKEAILQVGTFDTVRIDEKAYLHFKKIWESNGIGFLVQEIDRKDEQVELLCYYGSSTYDSKEMSLLIDVIINLAKMLGIETRPEKEIKNLLESWEK